MAPPPRRRVSYVIPPPAGPVPRLQLPNHGISQHGTTGPALIPAQPTAVDTDTRSSKRPQHPRHRLGVVALALDTSTQLVGRSTPEGILYTGGRDGLVISWELGVPMKKRARKYGVTRDEQRSSTARWEMLTGWADDIIEEEEEGEEVIRDGDVLGDVKESGAWRRKRPRGRDDEIPYEEQWEMDTDAVESGKSTQFRQAAQAHSDWVNDILLCNYNQTVLSASSDGTVKAWSPHNPQNLEPVIVGTHVDYVRCLALCREQNWVASGSFDRTIKLWDLTRSSDTSNPDPLITFNPPDSSGPKSSIYALAADPFGHAIASGSPERVVRMWDPRSGRRIAKLVGHTDNIRAILISEDSRYLLTGSADASIKLWSLSSQRCLHTFTHHTDSVWSLFSSHPSLEIFYSGDRSGLVCRVDVEDCADVSEGECTVLCQDLSEHCPSTSEGINKIAVMDDNLLWTAACNSGIKRWRIPPRRAVRASVIGMVEADNPGATEYSASPVLSRKRNSYDVERPRSPLRSLNPFEFNSQLSPSIKAQHRTSLSPSLQGSITSVFEQKDQHDADTLFGIPFESLVRLTSANDPFTPYASFGRGKDPEVATLYSATSVLSVPHLSHRSPLQSTFPLQQPPALSNAPIHRSDTMNSRFVDEAVQPVNTARADYEEREVAADAVPLVKTPDHVIEGDHGLVRSITLNDRIHALTVDTAGEVAVWDIVRGTCLGKYTPEDVSAASFRGSTAGGSDRQEEKERSPREALESVRERIEGEAVVTAWSSVDTNTGVLTVHLSDKCFEAEIYADEAGYPPEKHFSDELRLNIGKWILRNLFLGFIREEQRAASRRGRDEHDHAHHRSLHRGAAPTHIELNGHSPLAIRSRTNSDASTTSARSPFSNAVLASPGMLPAISPNVPTSARSSPLLTPMIQLHPIAKDSGLSPIPQSPAVASNDATPMPRSKAGVPVGIATAPPTSSRDGDYFSLRSRQNSVSGARPPTPDDFSGWGNPKTSVDPAIPATPSTPSAGGLMGKLRHFGKSAKRANETGSIATPGGSTVTSEVPRTPAEDGTTPGPGISKSPIQSLLSNPITPPTSAEGPHLSLAPNTSLVIAEEAASGWKTLYKGSVASTGNDMKALEEAMPFWLLEYLLANRVTPIPVSKVSFILLPYPARGPDEERLPELLNTAQSKLTASRFLRVRKLTYHVQDKLDRLSGNSTYTTPRSSFDSGRPRDATAHSRPRAEEHYEILCNDLVLPLDMTLAAVRQYVWRQSVELVMYYRRRTPHRSSLEQSR
ncbi:WD40 repeat-like protein [Neolentinus lepideus HHB14362 ss-1]|uniref:WD40 repeat-like protein n=1 Tax=Neolentinus lepideus HHB14362 ss-1 TaxID=1314782 RepID=A0A165VSE3_9AGAM|nr:WD40 repeat-like protein [Neolentinus lepideus HHB14362 ss-1]